jgi:AcrR family transcriptional regulator
MGGGYMMNDALMVKTKIEEAILHLMKTTNISKIKVTKVVELSGISRSTFYRLYDSVDDAVKDMERELLEKIRDLSRYSISSTFDCNKLDIPNEHYLNIFKYLYDHREFYSAIISPHGDPQFLHKAMSLLREFYVGKIAYQDIQHEYLDFYIDFALAGHHSMLTYWLTKRTDVSFREFCSMTQKLMYGIFKL